MRHVACDGPRLWSGVTAAGQPVRLPRRLPQRVLARRTGRGGACRGLSMIVLPLGEVPACLPFEDEEATRRLRPRAIAEPTFGLDVAGRWLDSKGDGACRDHPAGLRGAQPP